MSLGLNTAHELVEHLHRDGHQRHPVLARCRAGRAAPSTSLAPMNATVAATAAGVMRYSCSTVERPVPPLHVEPRDGPPRPADEEQPHPGLARPSPVRGRSTTSAMCALSALVRP